MNLCINAKNKVQYNWTMNRKSAKERAQILSLLVEGNSLRATTRIIREMQSGCSINTVTKLQEEIGEACAWYQDELAGMDEIFISCRLLLLLPSEQKSRVGV